VEIFFVISGFYIQLVFHEKYNYEKLGKNWIKNFYIARYIRLYPTYIIAVLVTLFYNLTAFLTHRAIDPISTWYQIINLHNNINNFALQFFIAFTNIFIFFQDVTMFLGIYDETAYFTDNFRTSSIPIWKVLAVPQAWSLGIELTFYFLAPFLLKMKNFRLFLVASTLLLIKGLFLLTTGLQDPWTYRFFPFELPWFFAGALAYRKMGKIIELKNTVLRGFQLDIVHTYLLVIVVSVCSLADKVFIRFIYPLAFVFIIPLLFSVTSRNKNDRALGELSYPFYIFHFLILNIAGYLFKGRFVAVLSLVITLFFTHYIVKFEKAWIEPVRQKLSNETLRR